MAFTRFQYHRRDALDEHGQYAFNLTGVEYGHDGIKNLKHNSSVSQEGWGIEVSSGSFTSNQTWDVATSRNMLRLTATATGSCYARVRFRLPRDYGSFPVGSWTVTTYRNQAITGLVCYLLKGGATDSALNGFDITPSSATTWQTFTMEPGDAYSPSDWVTFAVLFVADTIGDYVQIADFGFHYVTARGNV